MYCNGMGFRRIVRCTDVSHNSVINWVKDAAIQLPEFSPIDTIPEVGELDQLQTFVGSKKLNLAMDCGESF
jgi:hypothetical protein